MRIFRLVYEEIDTEDKFNPATNIKLTSQQTISDYELSMVYPNEKYVINEIKQKILNEITNNM